MTITLCAFCTAIVIVSVLGGMLPLATVLNHTRLQVYLSLSAGTMLGAAFFHMIPEAVRVGSAETVRWSVSSRWMDAVSSGLTDVSRVDWLRSRASARTRSR